MEQQTEWVKIKYYIYDRDSGTVLGIFDTKEEAMDFSARSKQITKMKELVIYHRKKDEDC